MDLENYKSEYVKRFVEEIDKYLKESTEYTSYASFAVAVGKSKQYFSDLKNGKSDLTFAVLDQACELITLDKDYILTGKRQQEQVIPSDFLELIKSQQRTIEDQQKTIALLSKRGDVQKDENAEDADVRKASSG